MTIWQASYQNDSANGTPNGASFPTTSQAMETRSKDQGSSLQGQPSNLNPKQNAPHTRVETGFRGVVSAQSDGPGPNEQRWNNHADSDQKWKFMDRAQIFEQSQLEKARKIGGYGARPPPTDNPSQGPGPRQGGGSKGRGGPGHKGRKPPKVKPKEESEEEFEESSAEEDDAFDFSDGDVDGEIEEPVEDPWEMPLDDGTHDPAWQWKSGALLKKLDAKARAKQRELEMRMRGGKRSGPPSSRHNGGPPPHQNGFPQHFKPPPRPPHQSQGPQSYGPPPFPQNHPHNHGNDMRNPRSRMGFNGIANGHAPPNHRDGHRPPHPAPIRGPRPGCNGAEPGFDGHRMPDFNAQVSGANSIPIGKGPRGGNTGTRSAQKKRSRGSRDPRTRSQTDPATIQEQHQRQRQFQEHVMNKFVNVDPKDKPAFVRRLEMEMEEAKQEQEQMEKAALMWTSDYEPEPESPPKQPSRIIYSKPNPPPAPPPPPPRKTSKDKKKESDGPRQRGDHSKALEPRNPPVEVKKGLLNRDGCAPCPEDRGALVVDQPPKTRQNSARANGVRFSLPKNDTTRIAPGTYRSASNPSGRPSEREVIDRPVVPKLDQETINAHWNMLQSEDGALGELDWADFDESSPLEPAKQPEPKMTASAQQDGLAEVTEQVNSPAFSISTDVMRPRGGGNGHPDGLDSDDEDDIVESNETQSLRINQSNAGYPRKVHSTPVHINSHISSESGSLSRLSGLKPPSSERNTKRKSRSPCKVVVRLPSPRSPPTMLPKSSSPSASNLVSPATSSQGLEKRERQGFSMDEFPFPLEKPRSMSNDNTLGLISPPNGSAANVTGDHCDPPSHPVKPPAACQVAYLEPTTSQKPLVSPSLGSIPLEKIIIPLDDLTDPESSPEMKAAPKRQDHIVSQTSTSAIDRHATSAAPGYKDQTRYSASPRFLQHPSSSASSIPSYTRRNSGNISPIDIKYQLPSQYSPVPLPSPLGQMGGSGTNLWRHEQFQGDEGWSHKHINPYNTVQSRPSKWELRIENLLQSLVSRQAYLEGAQQDVRMLRQEVSSLQTQLQEVRCRLQSCQSVVMEKQLLNDQLSKRLEENGRRLHAYENSFLADRNDKRQLHEYLERVEKLLMSNEQAARDRQSKKADGMGLGNVETALGQLLQQQHQISQRDLMTSQALSDKMETIEKLLCVEGSQDLTRQTRSTLRASPPSAVHEDTNETHLTLTTLEVERDCYKQLAQRYHDRIFSQETLSTSQSFNDRHRLRSVLDINPMPSPPLLENIELVVDCDTLETSKGRPTLSEDSGTVCNESPNRSTPPWVGEITHES